MASSISNRVEVFDVSAVSRFVSSTFTEAKISAYKGSTVVVVPEVMGLEWSPNTISSLLIDPTVVASSDSEV
jgi:hypothetical protein